MNEHNKDSNTYKSPQRKLVKFFEKSRNQWKSKCRQAKAHTKYLQNKVRDLERSRDQWRRRAQALQAELKRTQAKAKSQQNAVTSPVHSLNITFVEIANREISSKSTTS
jgi:peptidoglycan hydrolase CwlO-like protein